MPPRLWRTTSRVQSPDGAWSPDLKVFLLTEASEQVLTSESETARLKGRARNAICTPPSCNAFLIPGRDDNFLFYARVVHTARSDSACVSPSHSDRWLPDITHPVRRLLILNIAATTLSRVILFLPKARYSFLLSKGDLLIACFSKAAPKKKEGEGEEGEERHWPSWHK